MHWDITHSCGHTEKHLVMGQFAYESEVRARQIKCRK